MAGRSTGDTSGGRNLTPKERRDAQRRRRADRRTTREIVDFWKKPGLLEQQREREKD